MHTALYRKKRPKTFKDLVGQPHVVKALENQLETGQLSHAYLFCGTRGTGKTSAAKIFARAVNCQAPVDGGPCNICTSCQSILDERCMDVVEIDAASNNSVDNIRDLREEVRYPPTQCTHKVYIVDEVHMLSTSAFNALLKTLEEPPSHVIFILATTDPQKIPATILSRCQRYDFKRITAEDMIATMARYLQAESVEYEDAALAQIAYHSDGAMRDALSLLDQCVGLGEGAGVTLHNVLNLLGAVDRQVLFEFTDALAAYNNAKILEIIDGAMTQGRDVAQLTGDLVRHFRDVLVAAKGAQLDTSDEIREKLKAQGTRVAPERLIEYIRAFSENLRELRFAPHMRTSLEVCALRLCSPQVAASGGTSGDSTELAGLVSRLAKLEKMIEELQSRPVAVQGGDVAVSAPVADAPEPPKVKSEAPVVPRQANSSGALDPQFLAEIQADWKTICNGLPPLVRSMLLRCNLGAEGGTLQIICDNEAEAQLLKEKNRPLLLREALAERYNLSTPPNLAFIVQETYNKPAKAAQMPTPPVYSEIKVEAPPPAPVSQEPAQMGWDDYAQEINGGEDAPF